MAELTNRERMRIPRQEMPTQAPRARRANYEEVALGFTAELAQRMGWPVVLVIDAGGQAQSAAAVALGFRHYAPDLPFAGVIVNRVASPRHERLVRLGMDEAGIRVLGVLPRRGDLALPERHLGLIQAVEHPDLEAAVARCHSEIGAARLALERVGAAATGMSGSGPTVYGCFPDRQAAETAAQGVKPPEGATKIVVSSPGSACRDWGWGVAKR